MNTCIVEGRVILFANLQDVFGVEGIFIESEIGRGGERKTIKKGMVIISFPFL